MSKRIFSYEEAAAMLPDAQRLTEEAVEAVEALGDLERVPDEYHTVVTRWAESIVNLGIDVKGLWLIDFDNGSGYYCWRHPETSLQYFHGYEEGYRGRVKLN